MRLRQGLLATSLVSAYRAVLAADERILATRDAIQPSSCWSSALCAMALGAEVSDLSQDQRLIVRLDVSFVIVGSYALLDILPTSLKSSPLNDGAFQKKRTGVITLGERVSNASIIGTSFLLSRPNRGSVSATYGSKEFVCG